jgi:hypothetical protein
MADEDDWESFSVPTFTAAAAPPLPSAGGSKVYEEEEDLTLLEKPVKAAAPSASQVEAARKKAALEEQALANRMQFALLENETPEEKKIRERNQAIASDSLLIAADLGGAVSGPASPATSVSGVASIPLKNIQDHKNFAIACSSKLSTSTAVTTTAFITELATRLKTNISTEGLDAIIAVLQVKILG